MLEPVLQARFERKESTMRFSGSARGAAIFALSALVLAGCGSIPYPVATPISVQRQLDLERKAEAPPHRWAISLCYSRALNTPEELMSEARFKCGSGQVKFLESDIFWTPCSLQQPARATFICTPKQSVREAPPVQ